MNRIKTAMAAGLLAMPGLFILAPTASADCNWLGKATGDPVATRQCDQEQQQGPTVAGGGQNEDLIAPPDLIKPLPPPPPPVIIPQGPLPENPYSPAFPDSGWHVPPLTGRG